MNARKSLKVNGKGHLEIGGADCAELARQFGTPLYVLDDAFASASKAFSCTAIYAIAKHENIGVDVVSGGELFTAMKAGFPAERIFMHGNNKLPNEIAYALDCKVGTIVVDAYSEADLIDDEAQKRGMIQDVLLRINPGVEAHTHAYVQTATTDSKFGFSVSDGSAEKIAAYVLSKKNLRLKGFHCHIGSQIFEKESFVIAAEKLMDFVFALKQSLKYEAETLNLGGGFGIWYTDDDAKIGCEGYSAQPVLVGNL